jgi:eukaryotic translation initiation factor 2C
MGNDELQTILYEQVYQYARATTPVSMHTAVYYAHIASGRAGTHGTSKGRFQDDFCDTRLTLTF